GVPVGRARAAEGPGHRLHALRAAGRRPVGDRQRRRAGAGRVRRARLLPVVEQAQPHDGVQRRLPAPHPRGRPPVGARARQRHLLPDRHQPLAHPRADPAPPLQLLAAEPALRPRARRRHGGAGRHRRRPRAARAVRRDQRAGAGLVHPPARGAGEEVRRRRQRHQPAQAGTPGGAGRAAQRHRDAHRRHRQLPRDAPLRGDAGQRARRRRDPRAGDRDAARAPAGGAERLRRLRGVHALRRHAGRLQPARRRGL
ncbi:MAG: Thymidylate synthase ThyX, partial [uncultured Frankineae bacterium]